MGTKTATYPLAEQVGQRLRTFRLACGLKQETLATAVGYSSRAAIAQFENGFALPSLEKLIELARVLGVHPGQLLCDAEIASHASAEWLKTIRLLRSMADDLERTFPEERERLSSQKRPVVAQLTPLSFLHVDRDMAAL